MHRNALFPYAVTILFGRGEETPWPAMHLTRAKSASASLLVGAIDLHCHSGPFVMPRSLDHIEALHEAAAAGFRAMLIKDHYYSATPITELLNKQYGHLGVTLLSGVPLNNALGGFNVYAVDHGIKLGARLVWMPTFTAKNHIDANARSKGFPHTTKPLLEPDPLTVLDAERPVDRRREADSRHRSPSTTSCSRPAICTSRRSIRCSRRRRSAA